MCFTVNQDGMASAFPERYMGWSIVFKEYFARKILADIM